MTKKTTSKKRADKYEKPLVIKGSFEDVIKASLKQAKSKEIKK